MLIVRLHGLDGHNLVLVLALIDGAILVLEYDLALNSLQLRYLNQLDFALLPRFL